MKLKNEGRELTGALYTTYMRALAERGALRSLYSTAEEFKNLERNARLGDRFRLGPGMHVAFLRAYKERDYLSSALKYWDTQLVDDRSKTPGVYYEFLSYLTNRNMADRVKPLLQEMKSKGIKLTPGVFAGSVKAFGARKQIPELLAVVAQAKEDGITADIRFYRPILFSLGKNGNLEEFQKFYDEMRAAGIESDLSIYNSQMSVHSSRGDVEKAQEVVEEIKKKGLALNEFSHTILMKGHFKKGDIDGLIKQFEQLKSEPIPLTAVSYNTVLGYLKSTNEEAFKKYLNEMKENGIPPNESTKKILAEGDEETDEQRS